MPVQNGHGPNNPGSDKIGSCGNPPRFSTGGTFNRGSFDGIIKFSIEGISIQPTEKMDADSEYASRVGS